MRKSSILAGIASLAIVGGMATPAFASGTPISATATLDTVLSISNVSPTISFGHTQEGMTASVPHAEVISAITNSPAGAHLDVTGTANGWVAVSNGNPLFTDSSVTVHSQTKGAVPLISGGNNTTVENQNAPGNYTFDQAWDLSVPASVTYIGAIQASYTVSLVAN